MTRRENEPPPDDFCRPPRTGERSLPAISLLALAAGHSAAVVLAALASFFTSFNVMQAMLPSLVTKIAPAGAEGTATGIYSSSQFLGIFVGGSVDGWASGWWGPVGVFGFTVIVALLWFAVAATMRRPGRYST